MRTSTKIVLSLLILVLFSVWAEVTKSPSDESLTVSYLDVGQGDSILINRDHTQVLIDGGPDDKVLFELGKIMPPSDKKIEYIILTHPHADHLVGINQVIERYEVGSFYYSGVAYTTEAYKELKSKLEKKNIEAIVPEIGQKIEPFENSRLEFLWPGGQYKDLEIENLNDSSEVTEFCYFSECILFMGDTEVSSQEELVILAKEKYQDLKASILKIAHHGSSNGYYQVLIDLAGPKYTVISSGKDNKFGHPHESVLEALKINKIESLRTDSSGTISFILRDKGVEKK